MAKDACHTHTLRHIIHIIVNAHLINFNISRVPIMATARFEKVLHFLWQLYINNEH